MTGVPFVHDFKATKTPLADGDLLVQGWALRFDEASDREGEFWAETGHRLWPSLKRWVHTGLAPICWHHVYAEVLGRLIEIERMEGKGIRVQGVVRRQERSSPLYARYKAVKEGDARFMSLGGIFKREGRAIVDIDPLELSLCAVSVGRGTEFAVIAGKALTADVGMAVAPDGGYEEADMKGIAERLDGLRRKLVRLEQGQPNHDYDYYDESEGREFALRRERELASAESRKVDGPAGEPEVHEVPVGDLFGFEVPGKVEVSPGAIPAEDWTQLFGVVHERCRPERLPSPEEEFERMAREAARTERDTTVDAAVDRVREVAAILAAKEQA